MRYLHFNASAVLCPAMLLPVACVALSLVASIPAQAREAELAEARIAECIRQAAGGRPWLERTLWGLRDQEAGWIGAQVLNTNGSHDLGPLQINTWWVPKIAVLVGRSQADVRDWLRSDPCFNAGSARWIFLSALKTTGDFWKAVGVYHSPTGWRQRRYALSVATHMERRFGTKPYAPAPTARLAMSSVRDHVASTSLPPSSPMLRIYGFGILGQSVPDGALATTDSSSPP